MKAVRFSYREKLITFLWQLCLFVLTLNIGASIIQALENKTEDRDLMKLKTEERLFNYSVIYNVSVESIREIINGFGELKKVEGTQLRMSYLEALMLTVSLFFTLGWGHVIPQRTTSRIFCMLVSIIGIPLTILTILTGTAIFLQCVKDVVKIILNHQYQKVSKYGQQKMNKLAKRYTIPTMVALFTVYMVLTPIILAEIEGYTYFTSFWYCFLTFTTIGLGDLNQKRMFQTNGVRLFAITFFVFAWLIFGFIIVVATITALSETKTIHLREQRSMRGIISFAKSKKKEEKLLKSCDVDCTGCEQQQATSAL